MAAGTIQSLSCNRKMVVEPASSLEEYFSRFRKHIIGNHQLFDTPHGKQSIVYADWTATGRAYQPIEDCMQQEILPFIGNTHTGATITGTLMSEAYEEAKQIIQKHVGANRDDVLLFCGSGMTSAVNKLQRILGLRLPERIMDYVKQGKLQNEDALTGNAVATNQHFWECLPLDEMLKPVVFVTHMEHHSNHTSWLETIATVEIISPDENGNVDLHHLKNLLEQYRHHKNKIAAVTACSNVTGIQTPYHQIAKLMHAYGGLCFVDFACSAPYVRINMHPEERGACLDAIYFSPHKFLGGAGTPGVLIFTKRLYHNQIPDQPGGGTVVYSNPWKAHEYTSNIAQREDGGTPPFLGGMKAAMCVRLKEAMGVDHILQREKELVQIVFTRLSKVKQVNILAGNYTERLGVVSFIVQDAHYNLVVKILNNRFGIQARGGCSCAGTYGHHLLHVNEKRSYQVWNGIRAGDLSCKPGWVRISVHPTMTNAEIHFIIDAIEAIATHFKEWMNDYTYHPGTNEFSFTPLQASNSSRIKDWFEVSHLM